jgi:hypothetical protein
MTAPRATPVPGGVFDVDPARTIDELERTWGPAGYRAFTFDPLNKQWTALDRTGELAFSAGTPDELSVKIREHWQAMQ